MMGDLSVKYAFAGSSVQRKVNLVAEMIAFPYGEDLEARIVIGETGDEGVSNIQRLYQASREARSS